MSKFLGLPELASLHGADIDRIIILVHLLMFILFVWWGGFFLHTLFRFRAKSHPKAAYAGMKGTFTTYHEAAICVAELILLFVFSIPIYSRTVAALPPPEEATVVRVVGEQFAWNIHYPGADGQFGKTSPKLVDIQSNPVGLDRASPGGADDITAVTQLHLPVDKPVIVRLSSKDVIHSFKLPEMRITQDAIPGQEISIWFKPVKTGNWNVACAQLCGQGHSQMRGFLTVENQEQFDAWIAERATAIQPAGEGGGGGFWN